MYSYTCINLLYFTSHGIPVMSEFLQNWGVPYEETEAQSSAVEFEKCTQPSSFLPSSRVYSHSLGNASILFFITFHFAQSLTPHTCRQQ